MKGCKMVGTRGRNGRSPMGNWVPSHPKGALEKIVAYLAISGVDLVATNETLAVLVQLLGRRLG